MEFIFTENAPAAIGPYSQAVKINNLLFVSGQIPIDSKSSEIIFNNIEKATKLVLDNLEQIVLAANFTKENIVKVTIYLKDISNFEKINKIYADFFGDHKPARAVVEVSNIPKGVDIEIDAICYK